MDRITLLTKLSKMSNIYRKWLFEIFKAKFEISQLENKKEDLEYSLIQEVRKTDTRFRSLGYSTLQVKISSLPTMKDINCEIEIKQDLVSFLWTEIYKKLDSFLKSGFEKRMNLIELECKA